MWFIHVLCCVVLSHSVMSNSLWPLGLYSTRLLYPWGFSRKEYWSGLPCLPPGDLPNPRIEPGSPTLQADPLLSEPPGKPMNMGVGSQSLLQGIFLTQKSSWGLLHCRRILYQLSYQGSPIFVPVVVIQLLSRVRLSLQPHGIQYNRLPCSSSSSRACSNLCSSRWWYHSTISSSVIPFSSYLQSFPASESFLMSQLFSSGGQSIGVSASASVPPPNEYSGLTSFRIDWFDLLTEDSQESSLVPQFKSINLLALSYLYGPPLTSIHDYWKKP